MKKIFIFIIIIIVLLSFRLVLAEATLEIDYPEIQGVNPTGGLAPYLRYIYIYGLASIGILALGALMIGGIIYMTADSITSTEKAKEWIWSALGGLVLGLGAYLILNTINPDLVNLKEPKLGFWVQTANCADSGGTALNENMCAGPSPDAGYQCCGVKVVTPAPPP